MRPFLSQGALTVVILTRNEAGRLARCVEAIPQCYPILVLDCGSTDETVEIARACGCVVASHPWSGFAQQRNAALERCGVGTPWVLFVDADEVYQPTFFEWFEREGGARTDFDVAMVTSRLIFKGVMLRYAPGYPIYHPRLVKRGQARFISNHAGHGETVAAETRLIWIDIPYNHYFYNGDLGGWLHKHIDLASQEVAATAVVGAHVERRAWLSRLTRRVPVRFLLRFLYHYGVRGGFRDGRAGLEYALMYAWFEFTKSLLCISGKGL